MNIFVSPRIARSRLVILDSSMFLKGAVHEHPGHSEIAVRKFNRLQELIAYISNVPVVPYYIFMVDPLNNLDENDSAEIVRRTLKKRDIKMSEVYLGIIRHSPGNSSFKASGGRNSNFRGMIHIPFSEHSLQELIEFCRMDFQKVLEGQTISKT